MTHVALGGSSGLAEVALGGGGLAQVLVVGGGLAGARTCTLLRAGGFTGRITMVGAEDDSPYDRPPLTKDPGADVDLRASGIDVWAAADEVRLGAPAAGLLVAGSGEAPRVGGVRLSDGSLEADAVVVATGASAVLPPGWSGAGVQVLHTRADAEALWGSLGTGSRLAIVGGGWIGCEVAATAARRGVVVTVFEAADTLLAGRVPPPASVKVRGWLEAAGVEVRTGAAVSSVRGGDDPVVAVGSELLPTDRVLVALGVRPATAWLASAPVARDAAGAVLVDPWGRTDLPGLWAVGDAAARWSPRAGRHLPGGHWTQALKAPQDVVAGLRTWLEGGGEAWPAALDAPAPDPAPYVFSDIGERTLQAIGDPGADGHVAWFEEGDAFTAWVLDADGRLLGACSHGRPRDIARARRTLQADQAAPFVTTPVGG